MPSGEHVTLARYRRLYDQAARLGRFGAWECDLATGELTWTDGVYDLFELPAGSHLKRTDIVDLYVEESREQMEFMRAEAIRRRSGFVLDARIRTSHGGIRWMRLTAEVACEDDRPVRLFGAKQDVTDAMEAWTRLKRLADCDPLTALANRRVFEARYREIVEGGSGGTAGLALIDIDRFKDINDRYGHAAGDACLCQVAKRLMLVFPDAVLVARIGGDEFAVLLRPGTDAQVWERIQSASAVLSQPVLWRGRRIDIGSSIGVTLLGARRSGRVSEPFADADAALYAAKAAGSNAVRIYGRGPDGEPDSLRYG